MAIDKHNVVEQKYWALKLDTCAQGDKSIDASKYKAVIDSGTSLLVGPKEIVDPLIDGINVSSDCTNVKDLPEITFTIDGTRTGRMFTRNSIDGMPRRFRLLHPR